METYNSCNKLVFQISDIDQVKRFLSLGSEGGNYYVSEQDLTKKTIKCIQRVLNTDDKEILLQLVKEYSENNKCKKQEPLVYLLACCVTYKQRCQTLQQFRKEAYALVQVVCKIPTTLFMFIHYCKHLSTEYNGSSGWNNLHKNAVSKWYNSKDIKSLAYQVTKYRERHSYKHRDILRLCHIIARTDEHQLLYKYIVKCLGKGEDFASTITLEPSSSSSPNELYTYLKSFEELKTTTDVAVAVNLITNYKFSREHVPTPFLNSADIWNALLPNMPNIALLRTLNKITFLGLLDDKEKCDYVIDRIVKMKGIHPIQMLISMKTYSEGCSELGKLKWNPNQLIIDALNAAFYNLFEEIKAIDKRVCICLDVSGSMCSNIMNSALSASDASCAMSMILKKANPTCMIMGFSDKFIPLDISNDRSFDDNMNNISNLTFGSTDISLPFEWAIDNTLEIDAFIVITDNETNRNTRTPMDALREYREKMNLPTCKLIVLATSVTDFTIADPNDKYTLDIAGFDAVVPDIIQDFISDD